MPTALHHLGLIWPAMASLAVACSAGDAGRAVDHAKDIAQESDSDAGPRAPAAVAIPDPVTCLIERPNDAPAVPPAIDTCVAAGPDPVLSGAGPVLPSESQLGWLNPATALTEPYAPGAWAKLQPGLQGVAHAEMRLLLVDSAAPTDQPLVIEVAREVWTNCATRMAMAPSKVKLIPASKPGWWQPASYMATIVPMPPWMACGHWALFRTFWRRPGASSWRVAQVTVRLYLGAGAEAIPP